MDEILALTRALVRAERELAETKDQARGLAEQHLQLTQQVGTLNGELDQARAEITGLKDELAASKKG